VFRFYSNVLIELRYLEAKDSLVYSAFRASQIIKNGVYSGTDYIGGVITFDSWVSSTKFKIYDGSTIEIKADGKLKMIGNTRSYIFDDLNINNFQLTDIANGLYLCEFNATKESIMKYSELNQTSTTYQRLVYTR
jgi:hypothetical protein